MNIYTGTRIHIKNLALVDLLKCVKNRIEIVKCETCPENIISPQYITLSLKIAI